jgi:hypothetical protein
VEKFIAQLNIARFEELLKNERDESERRILEAMLREERVKLAAAETQPRAPTVYRTAKAVDPVSC